MYAHNVGEPRSQSIGIEQNAYTFGRQIQITLSLKPTTSL